MEPKIVTVKGKQFAMLPVSEFRRLKRLAEAETADKLPSFPKANAQGNYPALEYIRVSIARDIIKDRKALGLSQAALAKLAGLRQETLSRLESGKHSPTVRTVEKIERALHRATAKQNRKHSLAREK